MEIPLQAHVECKDGVCGRSVHVLINPVLDQVAHLVVREDAPPHTEYIVPVDAVSETIADTIRLRCTKAELEQMDPFVKTKFIEEKVPNRPSGYEGTMYGMGASYYWPYATPDKTIYQSVHSLQLPPGELAVHRGTRVEATDGAAGHVDEFLVNPENGHITHLVMREGHLWGRRDVIIPLSAISDAGEDSVLLKLNKREIEALPTFPLHRRWS